MTQYLQNQLPRWFVWMVLSLLGCLGVAPTWAQGTGTTSPPKILVLTTHEGYVGDKALDLAQDLPAPNLTSTDGVGITGSNGIATAFGFTGTPTTGSNPVAPVLSPAPQVTYLYGVLSIRLLQDQETATQAPDIVLSVPTSNTNYPQIQPALKKVRVVYSSTTTQTSDGKQRAQDSVIYVDDSTLMLDATSSASIFTPAAGGKYDLIVVGATYYKVVDDAYTELAKVMKNPDLKPDGIYYFIDSCCDASFTNSTNNQRLVTEVLNPATGMQLSVGTNYGEAHKFALNDDVNFPPPSAPADLSPFATDSFQSLLPNIQGGYYSPLQGVPTANILFRDNNNASGSAIRVPTSTGTTTSGYGIFFPTPQVFGGKGTCTFAVVDITPFYNYDNYDGYTYNTAVNNIGQAFIDATLPGGACTGSSASVEISPPITPVTLAMRTASYPITVTVTNTTIQDSSNTDGSITGGRVEAPLPQYMSFASGANPVSTTCKTAAGSPIIPVLASPGSGSSVSSFSVTGIKLAFEAACTITLNVNANWADPSTNVDPANGPVNSCINLAANRESLTIASGVDKQFSFDEGQQAAVVSSSIVCTAPELALTIPTDIAPSYAAGATVSYDVTITNLSQTAPAPALGAALSGLAPAGATLTTVNEKSAALLLKAGPVTCASADNCPLPADIPAGGSSTFTVSFTAPANSPTMAWTPTVALAVPASEVTTTNNSVQLASATQSTLAVQAQLNGPGLDASSALNNAGIAYNVTGCTATPPSSSAPLGINAAGAAQPSTMPSGTPCLVAFTGAPDPSQLPPGYGITGPVITTSAPDATTGNQTSVAVWTALPPGLATITGSVVGGPTPFPASLVGKTLNYTLTCQASPAQQPSGKLTIGANGQLTTTDNLTVTGGSTCTLTVDGLAQLPTAPSGYKWNAASAAPTGAANSFVVTLTLQADKAMGDVTPVPTLGQWALYLLSTMMLMAAALRLRKRRL